MNTSKIATFIYGNQKHYLDHLAPLASVLGIPLVVTDFEIEALAKKYYPDLNLLYYPPAEMAHQMVLTFDVILSTLPKPLFDSLFFIPSSLQQEELVNIWCPHGNSDKGHASYFMEGLSQERYVCVYGKKMVRFLKEKRAYKQLKKIFFLGNYRYKYFQKHRTFYHACLPFQKTGPTLLYAPTWQDDESSSSFLSAHQNLIHTVPKHWTLIIKPHPHLNCALETSRENILVLKDFPPIYPLLEQVDAYLGDMSSIGYDFLTFRRPLFFYNPQNRNPKTDLGLYLTRCGTLVDREENIFERIEKTDPTPFLKMQEQVYDEVFEKEGTIHDLFTQTF